MPNEDENAVGTAEPVEETEEEAEGEEEVA